VAGGRLGDRVAVIGGGPIGIAAALAARRMGADDVVVVEPIEGRRAPDAFAAYAAGD
jgi:threonine dehydrogenase-like Zn-dependent dehydrogenase